jgi:hypothetical protein
MVVVFGGLVKPTRILGRFIITDELYKTASLESEILPGTCPEGDAMLYSHYGLHGTSESTMRVQSR